MPKHWSKEEQLYFLEEILPKSHYATGRYSPQGLDFQDLAQQMQVDLDQRGQTLRVYNGYILFQHWYQKVRKGVTSRNSSAFYAPSHPGNATTQGLPHSSMMSRAPATVGESSADTGQAVSPLPEETFTVERPSSPAEGISVIENRFVNNSLLSSTYDVPPLSASSTDLPLPSLQRPSTAQPPPALQTISTTANNSTSFVMERSADNTTAIFNDVQQDNLGDIDQLNRDHNHVDPGETDQANFGDNNQLILCGIDTSTNVRKRGVDETENDTILTETAAKIFKTIGIKRRNIAELGSDPVSPSPPAGKKGKRKGKATKSAVPKKKAVDDGDDESSVVGKKPMTKSALHKSELASKEVLAISIESDNGNESVIPDANGAPMTRVAMMKRGIGPYVAGAAKLPNVKGSGASEGVKARWGPLPTKALGGGQQRARHQPATARAYYDIDEEQEYEGHEDDSEDHLHTAKCSSRQYSQHELGMTDIPLYAPTASYYQNPYGMPPHMQRQHNPYSRSYLPHPAYPQYDPHAMAVGPHQMPVLNRGATSFNQPHQPGRAVLHPFGVASTTDRPASSHANQPASIHSRQVGADPSNNPPINEAQRPPRPLGRIYVDGGHEVMTETCPCCRRGFD